MGNISPDVSNHPTLSKKCPNTELFLVFIFLYSDWMRRDIRVTDIEKNIRETEIVIINYYQSFLNQKSPYTII